MKPNEFDTPNSIEQTDELEERIDRHPDKPNKGEARYQYAYNELDELVDINDVDSEYRKNHQFYCIYCKEKMKAYIKDDIRCRHFTHKHNDNCSYETYLHSLAKIKIKEAFDKSTTFLLNYDVVEECKYPLCKFKDSFCLCNDSSVTINLKEKYDTCEIEKGIKGKDGNLYIADLLLTNSKIDTPPMLLEIYVTHECTGEKKSSGLQIIEFEIDNEDDVKSICSSMEIEETDKVVLYNFERNKRIVGSREIDRYVHVPHKGTYITSVKCTEASRPIDEESDIELNLTINSNHKSLSPKEMEQYINLRYNLGVPRCEECRHYHGYQFAPNKDIFLCYQHRDFNAPPQTCSDHDKDVQEDINWIVKKGLKIEVVKGELPKDYKVVLYGPHSFNNENLVIEKLHSLLSDKRLHNNVILHCPISSYSNDYFSLSVLRAVDNLCLFVNYVEHDWDRHGKSAPYKTIDTLLSGANAVIVFKIKDYNPTQHIIEQARKKDIPLRIVDLDEIEGICPKCGANLITKFSKYGSFKACERYPDCKYIQK